MAKQSVEDFLQDIQTLDGEKYQIVCAVRDLFLHANANLELEIKYGGLVFNRDKELLGGVFVYQKHISIEFSHGAEFADPKGLLEGKGKQRRHLKINKKADIEAKTSHFYIEQAIAN